MHEAIQITTGTEKQNAWATDIANKAILTLDTEITNNDLRPASDNVTWYSENLRKARDIVATAIKAKNAKEIIEHRASLEGLVAKSIKWARETKAI